MPTSIALNGHSGLESPCSLGGVQRGRDVPSCGASVLANDRGGILGESESAIASKDVIAAWDTASQVWAGLG